MEKDFAVVTLEGEWDYYRSDELRSLLEKGENAKYLILDFSAVRYIDSTLLTQLVHLRRARAQKDLPKEAVVMNNPDLRRIFEITNLRKIWPIYETLEEAKNNFSI